MFKKFLFVVAAVLAFSIYAHQKVSTSNEYGLEQKVTAQDADLKKWQQAYNDQKAAMDKVVAQRDSLATENNSLKHPATQPAVAAAK